MRTGVDLMGVIFWPPNFKSHLNLLGVIYVWIEERGLSLLQIETGTTVPPTNQPTTLYENWCPCAISNCHLLLLCSDWTSKSNISTSSGASWGKELSQKLFTGALNLHTARMTISNVSNRMEDTKLRSRRLLTTSLANRPTPEEFLWNGDNILTCAKAQILSFWFLRSILIKTFTSPFFGWFSYSLWLANSQLSESISH